MEGGRRGRESEAASFTVVVLERIEEGELRGERSVREMERKEERSWREEGRVSAAERGRGVVVGRGGGEEEVESGLTGKSKTQ